mmetsp:Transcript_32854/g.103900  ORF Transcript_32854/g.103900 Transcript_32854/m.103900 type:complete len:239 (-) Transcript_32854:621-1337(-)
MGPPSLSFSPSYPPLLLPLPLLPLHPTCLLPVLQGRMLDSCPRARFLLLLHRWECRERSPTHTPGCSLPLLPLALLLCHIPPLRLPCPSRAALKLSSTACQPTQPTLNLPTSTSRMLKALISPRMCSGSTSIICASMLEREGALLLPWTAAACRSPSRESQFPTSPSSLATSMTRTRQVCLPPSASLAPCALSPSMASLPSSSWTDVRSSTSSASWTQQRHCGHARTERSSLGSEEDA